MPEYLAPGVYVEEVSFRSKSIEGVSTTTTGFIGPARYGPVDLDPELITSLGEFERIYGDGQQLVFANESDPMHNYLWHAVRAFFEEGGKRLYVARTFREYEGPDDPDGSARDGRAYARSAQRRGAGGAAGHRPRSGLPGGTVPGRRPRPGTLPRRGRQPPGTADRRPGPKPARPRADPGPAGRVSERRAGAPAERRGLDYRPGQPACQPA